jgi:molecular chaperone DnaJ
VTAQREWFEKDYYKVLGVVSTATDKEITRSYRKLAKQYHPDANPGSEERFKEISAAYDVLGDADKRKEYDEVRRLGPMAGGFGSGMPGGGFGGGGGAGGPGGFRVTNTGDLGDLFGGLFGNRGGGGGRTTTRGPQRGADMEAQLHLSFVDAVHGVTTSVNVPEDARCSNCKGSGAAPGTSTHTCPRCGGTGSLNDNQGLFSLSTVCPDCVGRGTLFDTPCPVCHGSGTERRVRKVKVRIPPGVEDGQRIRVKGRGAPGQGVAPAGDLYVVVHVKAHANFGRNGRNLTLTVPVTFPEAALGTTITVPTLDSKVSLKVPAGTQSGKVLRVRGRGVPSGNGRNAGKPGDLMVKLEVVVPTELTDEQREAVESLAAVTEDAPRLAVEG